MLNAIEVSLHFNRSAEPQRRSLRLMSSRLLRPMARRRHGLILIWVLGIWGLLSGRPAQAGLYETLPMVHWAYTYIDELSIRGHLRGLFASHRPFTRAEVAEELRRLKEKDVVAPSCALFLDRLYAEFEDELRQVGGSQIQIGATFAQDVVARRADRVKAFGVYRLKGGYFSKYVTAVDVAKLDRTLKEDPTYRGKNWRGLTAYMEQAYLRVRLRDVQATFGRDFLRWGPGRTGALLLSDDPKPLDFFSLSYRLQWVKFTYFFSVLDYYTLDDEERSQKPWARLVNRFLAAQRLDFNLWSGKLHIGLSEAILFADSERTFGLSFFNPLTNYFELVVNEGGNGNIFADVDVRVLPFRNVELYGELLIDDYQVDRRTPGDLEPNEIGLILGAEVADVGGWAPTTLGIEYVRITNRTYNTVAPWEKYLYQGKPIGYALGNDFDRWWGTIRHYLPSGFGAALNVGYLRKGEGAIEKDFDTPWMDYTVEEGYSEPFPTGVVEKTLTLGMDLSFHPTHALRWAFDAEWSWTRNAEHIRGKRAYAWSCTLGVWWDFQRTWYVEDER